MREIEIFVFLLLTATILADFASRIRISYPILLVLVGMGISFVPGLKQYEIEPDTVFLVFLPPLLYAAAWATSFPDFKAARRPITLLATGCVLFTTTAVAATAVWLIPGFSWQYGFLLGAIISPPDAVAATTATKGLGLPRRVIAILEGESLVNDATGLTIYRYALAAIATGSFTLWRAGAGLFWVATAGIAIGLALAWVIRWVHTHTPNTPRLDASLTILTPFAAYLLAEEVHASGVLSVVAAGLYMSRHSDKFLSQRSRMQANAVWDVLTYLLNGIVFILIGLHLPNTVESFSSATLSEALGYGLAISAVVIVARLIWVYPGTYLPRWLSKKIRTTEPEPDLRLVTIIGWAGMRGVVSLAAALALPLTLHGEHFPFRNLILFITFCVIVSTLVLQGLSLPALIRWMGIKPSNEDREQALKARLEIAYYAIEYIEANLSYEVLPDEVLGMIKSKYEIRIGNLNKSLGQPSLTHLSEDQVRDYLQAQLTLVDVERAQVRSLRRSGRVEEALVRQMEYELDLEEARYLLEMEGEG